MASFVWSIVLLVLVLVGVGVAIRIKEFRWIPVVASVILFILSVLLFCMSIFVTNDEGQAKVLRSFTGQVQGDILKPGLATKAPWQDVIDYNIRNQQVIFATGKDGSGIDGSNGPQITIQDKEGVSANIDITVRYSIDPSAVVDVYKRYGVEENFIARFIENDIRAGVRTIPANYGTLDLLNSRAQVESEITKYLEVRWEKAGVRVESVSLQEIRYPEDVQQRFSEAQNARIEVEKANADLEANRVKAESNRVLAESLTEANLEQLKYETLREIGKSGNLIVVPEDFGGIVNVK